MIRLIKTLIRKKRIFFIMSFLCLGFHLCIASPKFLILKMKNQEKIVFSIDPSLKVVFQDGVVSLSSERYLFENIQSYSLSDNLTSVVGLQSKDKVSALLNERTLFVDFQEQKSAEILFYGIDGVNYPLKQKGKTGTLQIFEIPPQLPSGGYLLKIGKETIKIVIK